MLDRRKVLAAAAGTALLRPGRARAADTTVTMMHVELNKDIAGFWNDLARRYESAHPGVKVDVRFMEAVSYVAKLTTMLQSSGRPNILYSWAGGDLRVQVKAGVLQDLTPRMSGAWADTFIPAALDAYTVDGRIYGAPTQVSDVGIFYNKDIFTRTGLDGEAIRTWDDLLAAVGTLKAAGVTPFLEGGQDKWPLNEFWSMLAMRVGGRQAFRDALAGRGEGFADPAFVRAGDLFRQLADAGAFAPGFRAVTYAQSAGQFGNGRGAMMLMLNGLLGVMRANATDGVGIPAEKLGWFPFPAVPGGQGSPADTLGGINGWIVTAGSPPEAADFLRFFTSSDNQREAASRGFYIPAANGTQDAVQNPLLRRLAEQVRASPYHQNFYDKELGPSVGATLNDVSTSLAAREMTGREAARAVQDAWQAGN